MNTEPATDMSPAADPRVCARALELVFVKNLEDTEVNSRHYRVSSCGRYYVSKCIVDGVPVYDAWLYRGETKPAERIGTRSYLSAKPAEACCQRHADANP